MEKTAEKLLEFIVDSPSAFHTVVTSAKELTGAGFKELKLSEEWKLKKGGKYFTKVYDSALLAFTIGKKAGKLKIAASHTDFPCFRIKPAAGMLRDTYGSLNVEKYGGLILRTWLDRPLSLAGKVAIKSADVFNPEVRLVDFGRPIMTIPSLAIHMDREVNDKGSLKCQKEMLPLMALFGNTPEDDDENPDKNFFTNWLADELGTEPENILSYELFTYPVESGCTFGIDGEMISSPRLDNLTSVKACLEGIKKADMTSGISVIGLFDNEEVGSNTKQGAGSAVLMHTLERIYTALGESKEKLFTAIADGFMLSMDVAHALHPNYSEKNDLTNKPVLGGGVVLKQAASQAYVGDSEAVAVIRSLCQENHIACQDFVNHSDIRGGSTLGSIATALVPMRGMDIGVPILAMHSARETMAVSDQKALEKLVEVFFAG